MFCLCIIAWVDQFKIKSDNYLSFALRSTIQTKQVENKFIVFILIKIIKNFDQTMNTFFQSECVDIDDSNAL